MTEDPEENEEFYVVARILEASAKSEDTEDATERAAVYARTAERAKKGHDTEEVLEDISEDVSAEAESAVENLRLAAEEIETDGSAAITEKVDDAVVARLRSEYD
jgi:thioesterase domain-containing protein